MCAKEFMKLKDCYLVQLFDFLKLLKYLTGVQAVSKKG